MGLLQQNKEVLISIRLDVDHHKKLLELFELLFPEYSLVRNNAYLYYLDIKSEHKTTAIHWFEFCILYFPKAIGEWIGISGNVIIDNWLCSDRKQHLVDYLYELFKKHQ